MKDRFLLALAAGLSLCGCTRGDRTPYDYVGTLRTQTDTAVLVPCIEQAVGTAATRTTSGTIVDSAATGSARRYAITRDKDETVVLIQGTYVDGGTPTDNAVTRCLVTTAPSPR